MALLKLPIELTDLIFKQLPITDLLPLRATCKELQSRANSLFLKNHVKTRCVLFEQRSLDALTRVSEHPKLGASVEQLEICAYHLLPYEDLVGLDTFSAVEHYELFETNRLEAAHVDINRQEYDARLDDQERLIRTGYAAESLTRAMRQLTSCRRIVIADWDTEDDLHHLAGMRRTMGSLETVPYRTLELNSEKSMDFIRHIIHSVLVALVASKLQLENLEISVGRVPYACPISPQVLLGPPLVLLAQSPITSLRSLRLSMTSHIAIFTTS